MYGDSNGHGTSRIISQLHADNLAFAGNLSTNSILVIYLGKLKPEI
jgi:hypothetical protein